MENPFDIIDKKLDRIIQLLEKLTTNPASENKNVEDILDINKASSFLGIAKPTLYHYTSNREIPHFKRGKKLFFIREDLIKWVRECKIKTRQEIENEANTYVYKRRIYKS